MLLRRGLDGLKRAWMRVPNLAPPPPGRNPRPTPVHRSELAPIPEQGPTTEYHGVTFADPEAPCSGCAHSAAGAPFPGFPSGERPCGFCERNQGERFLMDRPRWYDGETPPWQTPMDCYIATDRLQQQRIFNEMTRLELTGKQAPPREKYPAFGDLPATDIYCCEGGPAPGGHAWLCWRWLGISFG